MSIRRQKVIIDHYVERNEGDEMITYVAHYGIGLIVAALAAPVFLAVGLRRRRGWGWPSVTLVALATYAWLVALGIRGSWWLIPPALIIILLAGKHAIRSSADLHERDWERLQAEAPL